MIQGAADQSVGFPRITIWIHVVFSFYVWSSLVHLARHILGRGKPCIGRGLSCYLIASCLHICLHYSDVIMSEMTSQITSISTVCSAVSWGAPPPKKNPKNKTKKAKKKQKQKQKQNKTKQTKKICVTGLSEGNPRGTVDSPHKGPVTRKMFPFDDFIIYGELLTWAYSATGSVLTSRKNTL